MAKAAQLAIEVRFVPLPVTELEERRERLRALLLRGALRWMRQHADTGPMNEPQSPEASLVEEVQK